MEATNNLNNKYDIKVEEDEEMRRRRNIPVNTF